MDDIARKWDFEIWAITIKILTASEKNFVDDNYGAWAIRFQNDIVSNNIYYA